MKNGNVEMVGNYPFKFLYIFVDAFMFLELFCMMRIKYV